MDIRSFGGAITGGGSGAADLIAVWSSPTVVNAYPNFYIDGTSLRIPLDLRMNEAGTAAAQAVIRNRANTGSVVLWGASIDDGGTVEVFGHSHATKPAWTEIGSNGTAYVTVKPGTVVDFATKITVSHGSGDSVAISKPGTQGPSVFWNSTNGATATNDWRADLDQASTSWRLLNGSSATIINASQAGKVTIGASGGSQFHSVNGRGWDILYGTSGVTAYVQIVHSVNAANSGAAFYAGVAGASAGDAFMGFNVAGATDWTLGIRNNASDAFQICQSSSLGTPYFQIAVGGVVTIGTGTATTHVLNTQLATAASDALTLGNGPAGKAGNPAVYIQINVNGTNRVIPAW